MNTQVRSAGFTLLEMLVTLVVMSLIATLVAQAMFHLHRIERLLGSSQLESLSPALRAEWLRDALAALVPIAPTDSQRFMGSASEMQGLSTQVPTWPPQGLAELHLRLHYDPAIDRTSLQLLPPAGTPESGSGVSTVLLSWPGREGQFRYRNAAGLWLQRWPEETALPDSTALPALIALETGLDGSPVLLVSPAAKGPLPSTRAILENM